MNTCYTETLDKKLLYKSWHSFFMIMQFIATQAFLTLISLPILTAWGLPTSLWSPLGNLFFSPILSLYLFWAVLVFFTELLCIPNGILIWLLDKTSCLWLWCMSLLPSHAVIGFARPHACILLGMIVVAFGISWYLRRSSQLVRASTFVILLCFMCLLLKYSATSPNELQNIEHDTLHITYAHSQGHVALIAQDSCLARKPAPESWLVYQMMSELVARTGTAHIDHFVLLHPRQRLFDALTAVCQQITLQHVYIPRWQGMLKPKTWRAYARMKRVIQEHGGKVHILRDVTTVNVSSDMQLTFTKTDKKYKYQEAEYGEYIMSCALRQAQDKLPA